MGFFSGVAQSRDTRSGFERDLSCISTKCVERVEKHLSQSNLLSESEVRIRDALKTAEVESYKDMEKGNSGSVIVYLKNPKGGEPIKTLFKPYRGELQGRSSGEQSMAAELGMYIASQALGLQAGTTGVIRELTLGDKKLTGYLQFFTPGTTFESKSNEEHQELYKKHEQTLGALALLDYITGNSDRGMPWIETGEGNQRLNLGNFLMVKEGSDNETIVPLDGGDAFNYGTEKDPAERDAYYTPIRVTDTFANAVTRLNEDASVFKSLDGVIRELHGDHVADEFKKRIGKVYHALAPSPEGGYQVQLKKKYT